MQAALKFRKEHFDIAISAKPSPMKLNNLFLWLLGAKMRYAVVSATQWHSKLINHPTTLENVLGYHQALKILRTFSPDEKKLSTDFFPVITPNNKNNQEYPLILFSVSNNRTRSLISNEQLALIACKIAERYPTAKFIISALPNDIHLAENLTLRISKNSQIVIYPTFRTTFRNKMIHRVAPIFSAVHFDTPVFPSPYGVPETRKY
ncbi:hypothetical protein KKI90_14370 [Xenorhabdus bovienii]|uniref:hypothetical protein n=1 Tax=Xenorhabdus bovienii TaxID=40576 RepID=UPI00237CC11C|nr:hypothetical protein [Xenorhabdus bovienii]MDE1487560.1 hypothetical protein [Xenorhabdus bovienii]MDE9478437.1 hypothetical protein [Xenorhabdus bovienii]MDE9531320.1 hypothetical protein [Xenorhabdus bovienii]